MVGYSQAYIEGYKAFNNDKSLYLDNPYPLLSQEWEDWGDGWCDAYDSVYY